MQVLSSISAFRDFRARLPEPVGFVPTMGYLHQGHLSLVQAARRDCRSVVVSIFVNPTQFGPGEDLARYPRDLQRDLALLAGEQVDAVWTPDHAAIYPTGYQTWVTVEELARPLEGAARPGHFRGVATVVAKLFNVVQPQRAYFGQKDAQQSAVIRRMAADLNFALEVVICPTVREADGLAMSSRNSYLNPDQRRAAPVVFQALSAAVKACQSGERSADALRAIMQAVAAGEPLAEVEYVSCAHPDTLQELQQVEDAALFSAAIYIGKTRLIDNLIFTTSGASLHGSNLEH